MLKKFVYLTPWKPVYFTLLYTFIILTHRYLTVLQRIQNLFFKRSSDKFLSAQNIAAQIILSLGEGYKSFTSRVHFSVQVRRINRTNTFRALSRQTY